LDFNHANGDRRDWNDNAGFFRFTAGRFLFNEADQLRRRFIKFNMNALANTVVEAIGGLRFCVDIKELPEGQYNKTFLFTMSDGVEAIAKVPNPNAVQPHFTTTSEVATIDFVRNPFFRIYFITLVC